ncbi:MAG TPA: GWxTD domain-containing protein [Thermoanaerobaculia bacterium]|jgi:GWxTD domain-containing protein
MAKPGPVLLLLALLAAGCGGGAVSAPRSLAELTNPFLGPEYTAWLVGAVSRIATPQEVQEYLALKDDPQAAAFVQAFWDRRDPAPDRPGNPIREAFDQRSTDADRLYSEAGFQGRRTDRGVLYVLYGPPEKVDFEVSPVPNGPPVEVWTYGSSSPSGLDGKRPAGVYRFIKQGELTVFYVPGQRSLDPLLRPQPQEPPL